MKNKLLFAGAVALSLLGLASCGANDEADWNDALTYGTSYTFNNGTTINIQKSYKYLAAYCGSWFTDEETKKNIADTSYMPPQKYTYGWLGTANGIKANAGKYGGTSTSDFEIKHGVTLISFEISGSTGELNCSDFFCKQESGALANTNNAFALVSASSSNKDVFDAWYDGSPFKVECTGPAFYIFNDGVGITPNSKTTQYFAMVDLYGCDYLKLTYNNEEVRWKA